MRSCPGLGAANTALISLYFAPIWGAEAYRALTSRYYGFDDRLHAAAASYVRAVFDLGLDGLLRASMVLAGLKFVVAAAFVAYAIDFARALMMGRDADRVTLDTVLVLAVISVMLLALAALGTGDGGLIRLTATEFLLVAGAIAVLAVERHLDETVLSLGAGRLQPGKPADHAVLADLALHCSEHQPAWFSSLRTWAASRKAWLPTGAPQ